MTREDCLSRKAVLDTLDTTDKFLDEDRTVENYKALLKECYEVLTPVTPPSEDCVSRQAVLEKINDWWGITSTSGEPSICDYIRELSPVTPTRKTGKWILHEKSISTGFKDLRECSCCKCYFDWLMPRNSYCPNCGAEMESEE